MNKKICAIGDDITIKTDRDAVAFFEHIGSPAFADLYRVDTQPPKKDMLDLWREKFMVEALNG